MMAASGNNRGSDVNVNIYVRLSDSDYYFPINPGNFSIYKQNASSQT